MSKVVLQGFILIPESDLVAVKSELPNHIHLTRAEAGCVAFTVSESIDNPLRYDVFEEFIDQEAFDFHQKRVINSYWGEVTVNVERHYEIKTSH